MEAPRDHGRRSARLILFDVFKRVFDLVLASSLLLVFAPLVLIVSGFGNGTRVERREHIGRFGSRFQLRAFGHARQHASPLSVYPALRNIVRGDLSFIGPRARTPEQVGERLEACEVLLDVRPGLFCLGWLRRRGNIAWDGELASDVEYVRTRGFASEFGMWLRLVPALLHRSVAEPPSRFGLLGFTIDNLSMDEAVQAIATPPPDRRPVHVAFLNAHYVNVAARNADYRDALNQADLLLPDGSGLRLAARMLGTSIRENVNGTDLFPRLCATLERQSGSMFLLGGRAGRAEAVAQWIRDRFPAVEICGCRSGYMSDAEWDETAELVQTTEPDVLLVGLGAPHQDIRIRQNLCSSGAGAIVSVGGLFDFYSGEMPRAPIWVRELGVEWMYRLAQEPARMWRRYLLGNALFLFRVWRDCRALPAENPRLIGREECAR